MYAQWVDTLGVALMLIGPLPLVWWLRFRGVWAGAVLLWGAGILTGQLIEKLDPARENGLLDALWLFVGLPAGFAYSLVLFFALNLARRRSAAGKRAAAAGFMSGRRA